MGGPDLAAQAPHADASRSRRAGGAEPIASPDMAPQAPHADASRSRRAGGAEPIASPDMAPQAPHADASRSRRAGGAEPLASPDMAPQAPHPDATPPARAARAVPPAAPHAAPQAPHADAIAGVGVAKPVLAVVKDLFFVARIRETARLADVPLAFARSPEEIEAGAAGARFVLLDLTGGFDYDRVLRAAEASGTPVLGFTTHVLARQTQPWHGRCARVVTKETLTAELPTLLREGVVR